MKESTTDVNQELDEAAVDTLKPGGAPGETKAQVLDTFVQLLAQLGRDDLTNIFDMVQSQYGPNNAPGAVDNSASNLATITTKPSAATTSMKEDVEEMFAGDQLDEDLKLRAVTIMEAAVNVRANLEMARLAEEFAAIKEEQEAAFEQKLQEQVEEVKSNLEEKLDQYLDYVVEQFMEENKLAIESGIRTDIAENFMEGLHQLFSEHYITVPDNKIDLVAEMKTELEATRAQLNEVLDQKIELENAVSQSLREAAFEQAASGLVETQVEKFRTLTEGVEYTDNETFGKKLAIIKENYFGNKKKTTIPTGLIVENISGEEHIEDEKTSVSPDMAPYVKALNKSKI